MLSWSLLLTFGSCLARNRTNEAGYHLSLDAELLIAPELMNETPDPRPVVVTITYEYIPNAPRHFSKVTPIWLDITGPCGGSDYPVPNDTMTFSPIETPPWTANITGHIPFVAGHIHDGGLDVQVLKNGNTVCEYVFFKPGIVLFLSLVQY